jgi:hypothetical protein
VTEDFVSTLSTLTDRRVVRHFLEMVVAMVVGMAALGPLWTLALDAVGVPGLLDRPEFDALVMATNMTVAMSAWMRYRGHGWRATAEMAAAMYVPFLVLFPPLWLGVLAPGTMLVAGHVLMLPAMAGAMLLRPHEYLHGHAEGTNG